MYSCVKFYTFIFVFIAMGYMSLWVIDRRIMDIDKIPLSALLFVWLCYLASIGVLGVVYADKKRSE